KNKEKSTDINVSAFPAVFICINKLHEFHNTEGAKHLHPVVVLEVPTPCLCSTTSRRSGITEVTWLSQLIACKYYTMPKNKSQAFFFISSILVVFIYH
ncbi:MAG: hypothetical protein RR688_14810, partial [Carnobacterium sp.]|uniref:hypothetical protein n=1 Tax=Carnobacterium sp. TaxID=48221 RepID=UPI002FCC21D0